MGLLQKLAGKLADRSAQRFWAVGVPMIPRGEAKVNYAHFVQVTQTTTAPGTLFLTNQRVIWRMFEGRDSYSPHAVVEELSALGPVGKTENAGPGEFTITVMRDGSRQALMLSPLRGSPQSRALCEQMYQDIRRLRDRYRSGEGS